jgi:hypothetical protein
MHHRRTRLTAQVLILALVTAYLIFIYTPPGPRSIRNFEADRTAHLELEMWQAYYSKKNVRLFRLLVVMLREQYRYSWAKAATTGFYLARPAARFAGLKSGYDDVLPDLERAYSMIEEWTRAGYDPKAVARAELAWWVARREPENSQEEIVGRLIAEEYALLYQVPVTRVANAGRLRAQAAALRDRGGSQADWAAVSRLLRESYRELRAAIDSGG